MDGGSRCASISSRSLYLHGYSRRSLQGRRYGAAYLRQYAPRAPPTLSTGRRHIFSPQLKIVSVATFFTRKSRLQHRTIVAAATDTELKERHRTLFTSITTFTRMGSVSFCLFCGGVPTPREFCVYISFIMRKRENATQNYSCCRNRHGTQRTAQNFLRFNHYLRPDGFCAVLSVLWRRANANRVLCLYFFY